MNNITISITGTAAEVRSAMAELLGTTAPIAVAAAAPAPAPAPTPAKGKGKDKDKDAPAQTGGTTEAAAGVDPFAAPAGAAAAPAANASLGAGGGAVSQSEGEVTYEELKKLMTDVLSKKSAAFALDALQKATGHKALTGMPKEKYPAAKAALEAALA